MIEIVAAIFIFILWSYYVFCIQDGKSQSIKIKKSVTTGGKPTAKPVIPIPRGFPIIGNAPQIGPSTTHRDFTRLALELGDVYQLKLFTRYMVVVNTPDSIREALVKHGSDWTGRVVSYRGYLSTGLHSLFMTSDVPYLKKLKQTANRGLAVYGSKDSTVENLTMAAVQDFLDDLKGNEGDTVDLRGDLNAVMRRMVTTLLLGKEVPKESPLPDLIGHYGRCFQRSVALNRAGLFLDNVPFARYCGNSAYDNIMEAVNIRTNIWQNYIQPHLDELNGGFANKACNLLGEKYGDKDTDVIQEVHVQNLLGDLFFGGTVTSSDSLYAFVKILCEFPEVQDKIADEISRELGRNVLVRSSDKLCLPYCRAFLLEAFRYTSSVPISVPRRAIRDTIIYDMNVPAEHCLVANIWAAHHDSRYWNRPYSFQPERFLTEDGRLVPADHPNRQNISIFGAGNRSCPGQNLATDNLFIILSNLVSRFRLLPESGVLGRDADPFQWQYMGITLQVPSFKIELKHRFN